MSIAVERILLRGAKPAYRCDRLVTLVKAASALVVCAVGRISSNNEKCFARLETLVPNAGRNDNHIAGGYLYRFSFVASEPKRSRATGNAENLVDHRVVMYEVVDTVSPCPTPSMGVEYLLKDRSGVVRSAETHGLSIMQKRKFRVVRNVTVIPKFHSRGPAFPNTCHGLLSGRQANARGFFCEALDRLDDVHGLPLTRRVPYRWRLGRAPSGVSSSALHSALAAAAEAVRVRRRIGLLLRRVRRLQTRVRAFVVGHIRGGTLHLRLFRFGPVRNALSDFVRIVIV